MSMNKHYAICVPDVLWLSWVGMSGYRFRISRLNLPAFFNQHSSSFHFLYSFISSSSFTGNEEDTLRIFFSERILTCIPKWINILFPRDRLTLARSPNWDQSSYVIVVLEVLGSLVEVYVEQMKTGMPYVENAVDTMAQIENKKAREEAVAFYSSKMRQSLQMPVLYDSDFSRCHNDCLQHAIEVFLSKSVFDKDQEYQKTMNVNDPWSSPLFRWYNIKDDFSLLDYCNSLLRLVQFILRPVWNEYRSFSGI